MDKHVVIIGGGAAGYTAAIYTSRGNIQTTLVTGPQRGGQLATTTEVENFPGFPGGVMGPEIMDNMRSQAERFGTEYIDETVKEVELMGKKKIVRTGTKTIVSDAVIIATGAKAKWLNLPEDEKYKGRGYSGCATCDGVFFRGKEVIVVGGGDTAMEESVFLTQFVNKVFVVHRRDTLRATKIMQDRAKRNSKIEFIWDSEIKQIKGDTRVESVLLYNNKTGVTKEMGIDGIFMGIGHTPSTEFLRDQVELDARGYILTKDRTMTNLPGVFAAGDVRDTIYRQAITAAADGCKAAIDCQRYFEQ